MQTHDPILKFVLQKENLPAALDIVKRAVEIRHAALQNFWDELLSHLKSTTPRRLAKLQNMRWVFWSSGGGCDATYYNLYFEDARFDEAKQSLNFLVRHYKTPFTFEVAYGIMWNKTESAKSHIQGMPQVEKVRKTLNTDIFKPEGTWWFGKAELFREDSLDDFLKKHAANSSQIKRKVSQDFWQLVEDRIDVVAEANHAIQRKHQR
jgi:hypothetical protein